MQSTSTVDRPPAPPETSSRTWRKAAKDLGDGFRQKQLWAHLGWQDIKQRYRRSVLGPLWITIGMGVTAGGLGLMYSTIFGLKAADYVPYMTVGFMIWYFIQGCLLSGTEVFIHNEGLIKQLPAPITVHVLRTVWREFLLFLHNLVVYAAILLIFQPPITWSVFLAIPAIFLLLLNGGWVVLLFGVASTRFRDIPPVVGSFIQLLFFLSPIVWPIEILEKNAGERAALAQLNPIYHFVEIVRAPMLGTPQSWHHWVVVLGFTVGGWLLALFVMRNYRARVAYWV
ncbi:ABC transporter permease [Saccharopolyspora indica]|uniref:galactan export ABC transporter permease subunit Wzm/RfbD n=1 Tax=Saccharopolyspora indica TaxID=1229659 RepID=UPI0022EAE38F|nr:ABC transporter permease [Saccharopolyspora indica]MDA3645982.1 ABC transporter permease [Saccharopolyspora indica]